MWINGYDMKDCSEISNVELRHLRLFVAVAETGGFSSAGERENVGTSTVSEAVQRLERHTGVRLFHRTSRRVELTEEGRLFLKEIRHVLQDFDGSVVRMREIAGLERGRVSIAGSPAVISCLLPPIITEFRRHHPGVQISLRDDGAEGVARRVASGEVDFGIAGQWGPSPDLSFAPLFYDMFGVVCAPGSAIAKGEASVPWSRLADELFIGLAVDTGVHALLRRDQPAALLPENPSIVVSNTLTLLSMVAEGLGITVLPDLGTRLNLGHKLAFVPLVGPEIWRCMHVITPKARFLAPAATAFLSLLERRLPDVLPEGLIRLA